jgi:SAM-dependent methyltransferase
MWMERQDVHFDRVAEEYDGTIPEHVMSHLTARRVALACSLVPGGRVLDVGCGTGRFLDALPERFAGTGVDVSAEMLERALAKGLDTVHASGDELPFEDASFDLVTTFAVLHHVIDPERVRGTLREMARVVRAGGALIVWDHNPLNPYWPILMARLPQDQGDERLVPARLIVGTLRSAGLRDVRLRRMTFTPDFTPPRLLPTVARVERALERMPGLNVLAAHNVVVARA